ncbi:MAG TPA: flavin reductase family protein [Acidimicrobiales bacterium]|nr:flavin reductase family protein [Acidimicrobiales bacterium]
MTTSHEVDGPVPTGRDPDVYDRLRRRVLWSMPSGLYVVGTRAHRRRNLMTISWATQVATSPKLVGIGVESAAVTHELLDAGRVFALNLLPRAQRAVVRRFAKPVTESSVDDDTGVGVMQGEPVHVATTGAPILDCAVSWLDCELRHVLALGSHSWFVGEVVDCGEAPADGQGPESAVLGMQDTRMSYGG